MSVSVINFLCLFHDAMSTYRGFTISLWDMVGRLWIREYGSGLS